MRFFKVRIDTQANTVLSNIAVNDTIQILNWDYSTGIRTHKHTHTHTHAHTHMHTHMHTLARDAYVGAF